MSGSAGEYWNNLATQNFEKMWKAFRIIELNNIEDKKLWKRERENS